MQNLKKILNRNFFPLVLFFFSILMCQFTGNRGVFPIDSFSHFDSGYRILEGEHPFKDYWAVSGPFLDYYQSFIFLIFGSNWQSYILGASLFNSLLTLITYYFFKSLGLSSFNSFFYSICFSILAYPSSGTLFVDHQSTYLSLLTLYIFIWAMKTDNFYLWFLVPVILIFAFLSKQVPAAYIFFVILMILFYHLFHIKKKKALQIIKTLSISSLLIILFLFFFFKLNSIEIKSFFIQYIKHPGSIGGERISNLNYDFKNTVMNYKFIYFAFIILIYLNLNNFKNFNKFYKSLNFKVFLIFLFLTIVLIHHLLLTKNQIFIFFLIPLILGIAHTELSDRNKKEKFFKFMLIIFCIFTTFKYHYRFNIDRKFHELNNVDFANTVNPIKLSNKFSGLKWITPNVKSKVEAEQEIRYLIYVKKILKNDKENKIFISNYSFFSIIIEQNISSYSRWFPGDNSAFPKSGDKYFYEFKKFIIKTLNKRKIKNIYILKDVEENYLTDYLDIKCFDKKIYEPMIIKFEINNKCPELFLWKN